MEGNNIFQMLSNGGGWKKREREREKCWGLDGRQWEWEVGWTDETNRGDGVIMCQNVVHNFFPFVVTSFCFVLTSNQFMYTYVSHIYLSCAADDIHGITWVPCVIHQEWIWWKNPNNSLHAADSFSLNGKSGEHTYTFFVWFLFVWCEVRFLRTIHFRRKA